MTTVVRVLPLIHLSSPRYTCTRCDPFSRNFSRCFGTEICSIHAFCDPNSVYSHESSLGTRIFAASSFDPPSRTLHSTRKHPSTGRFAFSTCSFGWRAAWWFGTDRTRSSRSYRSSWTFLASSTARLQSHGFKEQETKWRGVEAVKQKRQKLKVLAEHVYERLLVLLLYQAFHAFQNRSKVLQVLVALHFVLC